MRHLIITYFLVMGILLIPMLVASPNFVSPVISADARAVNSDGTPVESTYLSETQTGVLDPVLIEHTAAASGTTNYYVGRTDVSPTPSGEVYMPVGATGNLYSGDCIAGNFLVGPGGSVSFASPAGTISLWLKFDIAAPNGRFWGQHANFETRWASNQLVLDWGGDTVLTGTKSDWIVNHWYFLAITWDDSINSLSIYWADEDNQPQLDAFTSTWTYSVLGLLTENDIMSSRATTSYRVDGHVDDFRYYSVQRELDNLVSDYKTILTGTEPNLVHYYKFENGFDDATGGSSLIPSGSIAFSQDVFSSGEGWKAEQIQIDIRNLEILSALYGSFENGYPGTNVDWTGEGQYYATGWRARREYIYTPGRQRTTYTTNEPKYILIENEGYEVTSPNGYRHYNGTTIYWYQMVDNSKGDEQFSFNMNYLYQRGPIGYNYTGDFEFGFEILNGTNVLWNWSIDPTNITQRGVWLSTGPFSVDIPNAPAIFEIRVILKVHTETSYVQIAEDDADLDGDTANGMYLTFLVDDVSLTTSETPSPQHVDFKTNFGILGNLSIHGNAGSGSVLVNHSYWQQATIPFTFSSNETVSFEYSAVVMKMARFYNSSFTMNLENHGVVYEVELNQPANLRLYTYIQSYSGARDFGIVIHCPSDWHDPVVEDPFGNDITNHLKVSDGIVEVPSGSANVVGWWKIRLNGTNYASSVKTQANGHTSGSWVDETIYRSGERIRCSAVIAAESHISTNISGVNVNWYQPSGNLWWHEVVNEDNTNQIITNGTTLGPNNATIGNWLVTILWNNETEVAFGSALFEVRHKLNVVAQTPSIEIDPDASFTAAIRIYDQDNGNPVLTGAIVKGNWSDNEVSFSPNLAKGWWEADFNSTDIGTGTFVILIDASMPFYDMGNCSISLNIPVAESLFIVTARATLIGALSVAALFIAATAARRFYASTATRRNLELAALRGRIEDARNLIGVLVIHHSIGLPIYSKIIKGGFQESLLSSFITALSQFRSEFSWDQPKWTAIPITEVITAVQTEVLICAMITVEPASLRQRGQLEVFAKDIGLEYDLDNGKIKQMLNNRDLSESIDPVFFSHFDGALLERYVGVRDVLPKHLEFMKETLDGMDTDSGMTPEAIIKLMTHQGYSDRKSYNAVLEAVDSGYFIIAENVPSAEDTPSE